MCLKSVLPCLYSCFGDMFQLPDAKQFYLVADSVAELRRLAESFAEPEPIVLRRGKKEIVCIGIKHLGSI